jgi:hypothetical protein
MSQDNEKFTYPTKRSMRKTKDLLESGVIEDVQIQTKKGDVLGNLSLQTDAGMMIPRVFKIPAQAVGVGLSTIARLLQLRVVFNPKSDEDQNGS